MKSYAQRTKKPQIANFQQRTAATAHISNQAMLGMLNEPDGDTRFSEALRAKFSPKQAPDTDGGKPLPEAIRKKYEEKSCLSMDDVRVYYNSDEPAQFDADAFAYGSNVYIAPGKESLMDHEMSHVVQQKMGQVEATESVGDLPINRSDELEADANRLISKKTIQRNRVKRPVIQCAATKNKRHKARRPGFRSIVKQTYKSSRAKRTSIDHIISYENIRAVVERIAQLKSNREVHLRRLIKAVMPIRKGFVKTDSDARNSMIKEWTSGNKDIRKPSNQAEFLRDSNSSLSNLRIGDASINSAIGKRLDPIKGTFKLRRRANDLPLVTFCNTGSCTSDEFTRIKSIHKLARLATDLDKSLFYKPAVVSVPGRKLMVLSSDYSRNEIPTGSKRVKANVRVIHKKKSTPSGTARICTHDF